MTAVATSPYRIAFGGHSVGLQVEAMRDGRIVLSHRLTPAAMEYKLTADEAAELQRWLVERAGRPAGNHEEAR